VDLEDATDEMLVQCAAGLIAIAGLPVSRRGSQTRCIIGLAGGVGPRGRKGERGPRGEATPTIISWVLDRARYTAVPTMSDGTQGAVLELRELFVQFNEEAVLPAVDSAASTAAAAAAAKSKPAWWND
jgi:hypothetical protein